MIHYILTYGIKGLAGLVGATALYCGCFLYPDEENILQNRIEQFWIRIDERRRLSQPLALADRVARLIDGTLDRILGQRMFSFRMAAITGCFSLLGLEFWEVWLMAHAGPALGSVMIQLDMSFWFVLRVFYPFLLVCVLLLAAGVIASMFPNAWTIMGAFAACFYAQYAWNVVQNMLYGPGKWQWALFLISLASDVLCLAAVRKTIRWLIRKPSLKSFLVGLVVQSMVLIGIVVLPLLLDHRFSKGYLEVESDKSMSLGFVISQEFTVFGLNTSTGIVALSFLAVLVFMTLHKTFWPALSRALHPLARFEIVRQRKVMLAVGIACIAVISPPVSVVIKKASDWFH